MKKEIKAYCQKMSPEELQAYLAFKRHGYAVPAKKGKGSYDRKKFKRGAA